MRRSSLLSYHAGSEETSSWVGETEELMVAGF